MLADWRTRLAAGLAIALTLGTHPAAAQQDEALETAKELFSSGATAIGVAASGTGAYQVDYEDSGQRFQQVSSRQGIGLEARRMFGNIAAIALSGEYLLGTGEGPLNDGIRGAMEIDLFLNSSGSARLYVGGLLGVQYDTYDGGQGFDFNTTGLMIGPAAGAFFRLSRSATLGLGAEYHVSDTPISSYPAGVSGQAPNLSVPGQFVGRARVLLLLF
jgi:hypothetical protein